MTSPQLVEHFFRHEYGRLVAVLSCRVGVQHTPDIEDAVQSALLTALETWPRNGLPDNPTGWLCRVAQNHLLGDLRQRSQRRRILDREQMSTDSSVVETPEVFLETEVRDDLLRMLFVCCDDAIPEDSQLVLALKTLCGFSIREIAIRLFTTEANAYKRLGRARTRLREVVTPTATLDTQHYHARCPAVHRILYLLFTEGHLSSHEDSGIRLELCHEALRLTHLLAEHPVGQQPTTCALLALMHLHLARMGARQDASGGLLLLEEQDRALWDHEEIKTGLSWLAQSAEGPQFTRYHAEAGVAAEHCLAPSFAETNWERVADCYQLLEETAPSPIHRLNRAIATAEWQGPAAGLALLEAFTPPRWLTQSYVWAAVLADLHRRCGNKEEADRHRTTALNSAPTPIVRALLERRLQN